MNYAKDLHRKAFSEVMLSAMNSLADKIVLKNNDLGAAFITEGYEGFDCVAIISNTPESVRSEGYVLYDLDDNKAVFITDSKPERIIKYWVTMTDKHMSGWGRAAGKHNKLVFGCVDYKEACVVAENAANHGSQKYINICSTKPYYAPGRYYVQHETIERYPRWYEAGYFKK